MNFNSVEENAFQSTWTLIKLSKVKINAESLREAFALHHDFPTLASLSDILEDFNVPNLATKLSPEQLFQIPLPAIAHVNIEGGTFVTIIKVSDNLIEWHHNIFGKKQEMLSDFMDKWDGVTLLIEPDETSREVDYQNVRRKMFIQSLRIPFVITGLLVCLFFLIYPIIENHTFSQNWQFYGLITSKSIGSALSILLIWYSLDANNPLLNKICQLNKKTDCQNILSSEAASIGEIISWSEVGLIYFLGGLVSLLLFQKNPIPLLQVISLFALPYTFWSVYHQAFVAKIWCPLCLGVQVLLWTEFIISLPISINPFPFENYTALSICFLFVATLIAFIKKPLKDSFQLESLNIDSQKLKFNPDFVQSLLSKEVFLPSFNHGMRMIEIGNFEAKTAFQIVINPTCGACRHKFLGILSIVENNDDVKYNLILSSSSKEEEISNQVTKTILGLSDDTHKIEALYTWFKEENPDFEVWKKSLKVGGDEIEGEMQRLFHRKWINEANITHVPVTYMNNVEIPTMYNAKEAIKLLKYFSNIGFRNQQ